MIVRHEGFCHIKNDEISDEELDKKIKEKLGRYMGAVDIVDVEEIEEKQEDK